jgi:hypothetical protein
MTTRAGIAGLLTGLVSTIYLFIILLIPLNAFWIGALIGTILPAAGGFLAARWSRSVQLGRCAALGGLAGGLTGSVVYCLLGAAMAGGLQSALSWGETLTAAGIITEIIRLTMIAFLVLFLGGGILGMLGGWLTGFRQHNKTDVFDKSEPQMAMNASITALPASIVAATLAAAIFPRLSVLLDKQAVFDRSVVDMPLEVSLLLVLVSHLAVTLVVPHETRQAEHLCGMDEVKMAAYVGIGAAPLLILLLWLVDVDSFKNPLVLISLLASSIMSLISLDSLIRLVMPKRASFPPHEEGRQKTEAVLFGSIANSQGPRLVELCIGCGLLMVLPLYVTVLSVLINITKGLGGSTFAFITDGPWSWILTQALASTGVIAISAGVLTAIYLFYLNLGRWFSRRNAKK